MARDNLKKHKKSDKIKWVFTGIAFVLVFVLLAGLCMQVFGAGKVKPSEWFKKTEQEQPTEEEGMSNNFIAVPSENKVSRLSLEVTPYASTELEDGSLMVPKTDTYSLKPIIKPAESEATDFIYTGEWVNGSSEWAQGKNVLDYITITAYGRNATVQVKQAFGESIRVWCTYEFNSSLKDYIQFEYVKPLNVEITNGALEYFNESDTSLRKRNIQLTYGTGTVQGQFEGQNICIELSSEAFEYLTGYTTNSYGEDTYTNKYYDKWYNQLLFGSVNLGRGRSNIALPTDWLDTSDDYYSAVCTDFIVDKEYYFSQSNLATLNNYLTAMFKDMAMNTTENIRMGLNYTYSYDGFKISGGEVYTPYYSMKPECIHSTIFDVTDVSFNQGEPVIFY